MPSASEASPRIIMNLMIKGLIITEIALSLGVDGLASLSRWGIFTAKNLLCCADWIFIF
jgi:hypothetical protein